MYVDARRTSLRQVLPATLAPTPGQQQRPPSSLALLRRRPLPPRAVYFFVLLLLSGSLLPPVASQNPSSETSKPSSFYPYGRDAGDNATARLDDGGSGKITLRQHFPFFAKKHNKLYVSTCTRTCTRVKERPGTNIRNNQSFVMMVYIVYYFTKIVKIVILINLMLIN